MTTPFCYEFKVQGSKFKVDPEGAIHAEDVGGHCLPFSRRAFASYIYLFFPERKTQKPFLEIGPDQQNLKSASPKKIFKGAEETADKLSEARTVPEKGKLLERAGRKITGLQPPGSRFRF